MAIMKAKDLVEIFKNYNPDDEVWITYLTKDDVKETFSNFEYTDENDNLIDTDPLVSDEVVKLIFSNLGSDSMWEVFGEDFSDSCRNALDNLLQEKEEAEKDSDLWDKEEASVS